VEFQHANLVGFVSDESSAGELEAQLDTLAERMVRLSHDGYVRPQTFLGVGGMKVFRDDIWGGLRIVFRADHRAYKRMGVYDFPQSRLGWRLLVPLASLFTALALVKKRFQAVLIHRMIQPYRRVLDRIGQSG